MKSVINEVKKVHGYRYGDFACLTYLLTPVDPTEEKGSFLDIVKDRLNFQVENSRLKAEVKDLTKDKLELELTNSNLCQTNSLLVQQIQELQGLLETKADFYSKSENFFKKRYEQTESNYKSSLEELQNFKDNCRRNHMTEGKLIKELTSSKEKLKKANKRIGKLLTFIRIGKLITFIH